MAFLIGLTVRKDHVPPFGCDYEGFVVAGLDAVVDIYVPLPQRFPHAFDLSLDALLDGAEDHPGIWAGESADGALTLNVNTPFVLLV